ncbi:hypothetical protein NL676_026764 [Syzygium grande]|nr:hypothetical protein NL676_026764 [Syzygium grande]
MSRESGDAFALLLKGKERNAGRGLESGPTVAFDLSSSRAQSQPEGRYSQRGHDTWRAEDGGGAVLSVWFGLGIDPDGPVAIRGPVEPNGSIGLVWWAGLSVLTDEDYF